MKYFLMTIADWINLVQSLLIGVLFALVYTLFKRVDILLNIINYITHKDLNKVYMAAKERLKELEEKGLLTTQEQKYVEHLRHIIQEMEIQQKTRQN